MVFSHRVYRLASATMVLAAASACADETRLVIRQEADPTGKYPESKLYIGMLVNSGTAGLPLKAVQMPGGYVGSGIFFNCSIDRWNARKKMWVELRKTELKGFPNPRIDTIVILPKEERAVCREMLPDDSVPAGSCLRFRLADSWESGSRHWTSVPFAIGSAGTRSCPAAPSRF